MLTRISSDDLDRLEDALRSTLDLVSKERFARMQWDQEDKVEWQRMRVNRCRHLMLALSEYL